MRLPHLLIITSLVLIAPTSPHAQVAGSTLLGVSVANYRKW